MPCVQERLARALLALAGEGAAIAEAASRPWMPATFTGERHRLVLALPAAAAGPLAAMLPGHEFTLAGQLVAAVDVGPADVADGMARVVLEVLTIEAR